MQMGKPAIPGSNSFSNIRKYNGPAKNLAANKNVNRNVAPKQKSKGDIINEVTGYREKSIYKNGEEHGKIGKDGFMKLLTTQLQNQDPLNPMDQNKFAADLAQFSQLEQMTNMNETLKKSFKNDMDKQKFYAASFLGKEVITGGSTVHIRKMGDKATINFNLATQAKNAIVRLFDEKNNMIKQFDLDALPKGQNQIRWDGLAQDGTPAQKGYYVMQVMAWDKGDQFIPVETKQLGVVSRVSFDDHGETVLTVDGKKVYLRDVQTFQLSDEQKMMHNENVPKQPLQQAHNKYQQAKELQ